MGTADCRARSGGLRPHRRPRVERGDLPVRRLPRDAARDLGAHAAGQSRRHVLHRPRYCFDTQ